MRARPAEKLVLGNGCRYLAGREGSDGADEKTRPSLAQAENWRRTFPSPAHELPNRCPCAHPSQSPSSKRAQTVTATTTTTATAICPDLRNGLLAPMARHPGHSSGVTFTIPWRPLVSP